MSYTTPEPPARTRPTVVTVANALLILVAVLYVLGFIMVVSQAGAFTEVYREAFAGTDAEGTEGVIAGVTVGTSGLFLLFAIGLVILAILNNKGKNPARIVTWVLGGIAVCCGGLGLLASGANLQAGGDIDQAQIDRLMSEQLPGWFDSVNMVSGIVQLVALIMALILLALPAANEFFRKQEPPFEPPPNYPPPSTPPAAS